MKRSPLKRTTRLSPVSAKRRVQMKEYTALRRAFLLAHPLCQVWLGRHGWSGPGPITGRYHRRRTADTTEFTTAEHLIWLGCPPATDIHHKAGRHGSNYLDTSTWMAVSREGHETIHQHPARAREVGWLK